MRHIVACLIIFSLVSLSLPAAFAQDNLTLEIKADKSTFLVGEPVIIYASLKNTNTTTEEVLPLEPEAGFATYMIKSPDGSEVFFLPWVYHEFVDPKISLASGEVINAVSKIFYGGNGWTFKTPGAYEVWAVYPGNLNSNRLILDIIQPDDQSNLTASELFLGSDEVGKFLLFEGGDHLKHGIERLNQVASQFPETPHAAYANYVLGKSWADDFANFAENRLRPSDPQLSAHYLEKVDLNKVGFYYTIETYLTLSDAYNASGNTSLSESIIIDLNQTASEKFNQFTPILQERLARKEANLVQ
jgi:hypothetical protein